MLDSATIQQHGGRHIRSVERIGNYRVEYTLGEGGMGEVLLAWDERLHRHVAIKRIRAELQRDGRHRLRFRREARAVARLGHPSIVQVFDLLEDEQGDCLVMERVEGRTLAEALARSEVDTGLALHLAAQIAAGLAQAHAKGLVHRDLKPQNVIVTPAGDAKILDFGLARALWSPEGGDVEEVSVALTEAGALVGTVHAMSPEQASGRPADHRSDLFALGGLLYEMFTGRAPFRGENWLDTLRRVTGERPEPLALLRPDLPNGVTVLVEQLLAKDPEKRPQNARVVADELAGLRAADGTLDRQSEAADVGVGLGGDEDSRALEDLPTGEWIPPGETPKAEVGVETAVRTLLLVELVGRSALYSQRDHETAASLLARYDQRLRDLVARHGGVEVWKADEMGALFERPADAVACALAYHHALAEISGAAGARLEARAAVHLGEVQLRRHGEEEISRGARPLEVEGLAKTTAARLLTIAGPCQTLATRGAFDLARRAAEPGKGDSPRPEGLLRCLAHGAYLLDGAEESFEVFEIGVDGLAPLTPPADGRHARRAFSPSELKMLGWRPALGQGVPRRPHWTLEERLGEGGFGEVWLARHKSGERRVFKFCFEAARLRALKREVTLFRLLKEALGHRDDIARILDWHFEDAPFFVESEYTEGGDLATWAEEQGGLDAVPLELRLELAAEVAEALAAAHSVGILHKDIKPENVLVTHDREGRPRARLTDFGIGLLTERERLESPGFTALGFTETATPTDSGAGTLGYLAPELVEGRTATVQADVYSLGVLVYQLAVGDFSRILASGWERDVYDEVLVEDIACFTDGRPEQRPSSAREIAERLRTLEKRRRIREQEEARQRAFDRAQRRRRLATVAASVSLAVLVIVAVMAVRENRARRDAEAAREQMSLRQAQAEGLLSFMLKDLYPKLRSVGRLDVLDSVGEQAMKYFAAIPADQLSDSELSRRSQALYQVGQVRFDQGQLAEALVPFEESLALARELAARHPQDVQRLFYLGQSYFWVGSADLQQGNLIRAKGNLQRYFDISEELVEADPGNLNFQMELSYANSNLGTIAELEGELTRAHEFYLRTLDINEQVVEENPANRKLQSELAAAHNTMGDISLALGLLPAAQKYFRTELSIRERLLAAEPADKEQLVFNAVAHGFFGHLMMVQGEASSALEHARIFNETFHELVAHDPSNADWKYRLAASSSTLGLALDASNAPSDALEVWERQYAIMQKLVALDPLKAEWQRERLRSIHNTSLGRLRLGLSVSLDEVRRSLEQYEVTAQAKPIREQADLHQLTVGHYLLGELYSQAGDRSRALGAWQQAMTLGESLLETGDTEGLITLAKLAIRLGDDERSKEYLQRITTIGLRDRHLASLCREETEFCQIESLRFGDEDQR